MKWLGFSQFHCAAEHKISYYRGWNHFFSGWKITFFNSMKIGGNAFEPPATRHHYTYPAITQKLSKTKAFSLLYFYPNANMTGYAYRVLSILIAQKQVWSPDPSFQCIVSTFSLRYDLIICTQGPLIGLQSMKHFEMLKALALNCMLILKSL